MQIYLRTPVARVARPVARLIGYARVPLRPQESAEVHVTVPADAAAYTGPEGSRIIEPGPVLIDLSASSTDVRHTVGLTLTGETRVVGHDRRFGCEVSVK